MRFRRFLATVLAPVVAGTLAVIAVPQPAAADGPVFVTLMWVRCQDETGEWGVDEIQVEVGGNPGTPAGIVSVPAPQTRSLTWPPVPGYQPTQEIIGASVWVWVWERDGNNRSAWDLQGVFEIRRDLLGEHEGHAFWDGEFIVGYKVFAG